MTIQGANIVGIVHGSELFNTQSDSNGVWEARLHLPDGSVHLTIESSATLHRQYHLDNMPLNVDDDLWINIPMEPLRLQTTPDSMSVYVDPGDSATATLACTMKALTVWSGRLA